MLLGCHLLQVLVEHSRQPLDGCHLLFSVLQKTILQQVRHVTRGATFARPGDVIVEHMHVVEHNSVHRVKHGTGALVRGHCGQADVPTGFEDSASLRKDLHKILPWQLHLCHNRASFLGTDAQLHHNRLFSVPEIDVLSICRRNILKHLHLLAPIPHNPSHRRIQALLLVRHGEKQAKPGELLPVSKQAEVLRVQRLQPISVLDGSFLVERCCVVVVNIPQRHCLVTRRCRRPFEAHTKIHLKIISVNGFSMEPCSKSIRHTRRDTNPLFCWHCGAGAIPVPEPIVIGNRRFERMLHHL
mmetsp:Transcript_18212/g.40207  ORF Transcript_18212/g.40207 Transcript_18212/m.40207 type:complete len:299 (+) Transcript_18212:702-1598(+)